MKGFKFAGICAGIKKKEVKDLGLIFTDAPASAAALFTRNQVVAAPVILGRETMEKGMLQAVLVNSGNANCFTGEQGIADAKQCAKLVGRSPEHRPCICIALLHGCYRGAASHGKICIRDSQSG